MVYADMYATVHTTTYVIKLTPNTNSVANISLAHFANYSPNISHFIHSS